MKVFREPAGWPSKILNLGPVGDSFIHTVYISADNLSLWPPYEGIEPILVNYFIILLNQDTDTKLRKSLVRWRKNSQQHSPSYMLSKMKKHVLALDKLLLTTFFNRIYLFIYKNKVSVHPKKWYFKVSYMLESELLDGVFYDSGNVLVSSCTPASP